MTRINATERAAIIDFEMDTSQPLPVDDVLPLIDAAVAVGYELVTRVVHAPGGGAVQRVMLLLTRPEGGPSLDEGPG